MLGAGLALAMLGALWLFAGTAQACSSADDCMNQSNQDRLISILRFQQAADQSRTADQKFAAASLYEAAFEERSAAGDSSGAQRYAGLRDQAYSQGAFLRAATQENFKQGVFLKAAADALLSQALAFQDAADEPVTGEPPDGDDQASVASNQEKCKDPKNFRSSYFDNSDTFFIHFDGSHFCHRGGYAVTHVDAPNGNPYGTVSGSSLDKSQPAPEGCEEWRSWYHYNHRVGGVLVLGGDQSGRKVTLKCRFRSNQGGGTFTEFGQVTLYFHSDGSYHYGKTTWWAEKGQALL